MSAKHAAPRRSSAPRRWLAGSAAAAVVLLGLPVLASPAGAATITAGGFDIQGDLTLSTPGYTYDWNNVPAVYGSDPVGNNDTSVFQGSSSEGDDPLTWTKGTKNSDSKNDIGDHWTWTHIDPSSTHLWFYFAFDRVSDNGTDYQILELNQKGNQPNNDNSMSVPNRTDGDIRLVFHDQGSGAVALDSADMWQSGAWVTKSSTIPPTAFYGASNKGDVTIPSKYANPVLGPTLPADTFIEVGFDLDALGLRPACPQPSLGTANFRNIAGNSLDTSALKDYITPISITVPSTCATVQVTKAIDPSGDTYWNDGTSTSFPLSVSGNGVLPSSPQSLSVKGGATSKTITVDPGKGSSVTVSEGSLAGIDGGIWSEVGVSCTVTHPDGTTTTTSDNSAVTMTLGTADSAACTVTNKDTAPAASVKVTKSWTIDGTDYADGTQPSEFGASPTISGQTAPVFGTTYTGYKAGKSVTIGENTTIPSDCQNVASGDLGTSTLAAGLNTYAIHNTVICDAGITVDKIWIVDGVQSAKNSTPIGFTPAKLSLTKQTNPSFGTTYSNYHTNDVVTVGESVTLPAGCSYVKGSPTGLGDVKLARGPNTVTVTNSVVCPSTVTVNKVYVVDGTTYPTNTVPDGFGLTATVSGTPVDLGATNTGYHWGQTVTIGETNLEVPSDCSAISEGVGGGDKTLAVGPNTYTITNTYHCDATVEVDKTWVVNGTSYANGQQPAGLTAALTLTGQKTPAFGTTYGGYHTGDVVTVGETYDLANCTLAQQPAGLGDKTLIRGSNTYSVTNYVTCRTDLSVAKFDADTKAGVTGGTFQLWTSDQSGTPTGSQPVASCTITTGNTCTVTGIGLGTYVWKETVAPQGYTLPVPALSGVVTVTAANLGTLAAVSFNDPEKRTTIEVVKIDATSKAVLPGADFTLWRDGGNGTFDNGKGDDKAVAFGTTGPDGTIDFPNLLFGTYFAQETAAPTGYFVATPSYEQVVLGPTSTDLGGTVMLTFENPRKSSSIVVVKKDKDTGALLGGFTFALRSTADGANLKTCNTDPATGSCTFSDLDFGTYYVAEIAQAAGYQADAPVQGPFTVSTANAGDVIATATFTNSEVRSTLVVKKVDAATGAALSGATFELRAGSADGDLVGSCTTGTDGTCPVGKLLFGTYVWVETAAPAGYTLPATTVSDPITVSADNAGTTFAVTTFADPQIPSTLTVKKVDASTGAALAGATFELRIGDAKGTAQGAVQDTCSTGTDGTCSVSGLPFGTYVWVETAAPTGYTLPSNPVSDPIAVNADNAGKQFAVVAFTDPQVLSTLTVAKTDATTQAPLGGATFELRIGDSEGKAQDSCTTGTDGTCSVTGVPFGTYVWVETVAPKGYTLPATTVSDPITVSAANAGSEFAVVTFADPQVLSALTVKKVDAADGTTPLAGANFDLRIGTADGNVQDTCTTGTDGTCTVTGLPFGTYVWVETQAPAGYDLPSNPASAPITINADNAGTTLPVTTFADKATPVVVLTPDPTLTKTADPTAGTQVPVGQVITYTLTAGNTGNAPATGNLVDTLPANVSVVGNYTRSDGVTPAGPDVVTATQLTWNDVTVEPGQTLVITYQVKVLSAAAGTTLVNTATWSGKSASTKHPVTPAQQLPKTGSSLDPGAAIGWSGLLLALGAGMLWLGRRREDSAR